MIKKGKDTQNRTKERVKGNRSSIYIERTGKKRSNRKSTNKTKMKHRNKQRENRGNNKCEGKKIKQEYHRILTKRSCLKKTEARAKQMENRYQIEDSKR